MVVVVIETTDGSRPRPAIDDPAVNPRAVIHRHPSSRVLSALGDNDNDNDNDQDLR